MEIPPGGRKIRFGHCTLDDGRGVLIAPNGTETLLRPKALELLRLLLRNPGRVLGRDEIMDAVWPGVFVTDDSVTQCVVELRKGMGEIGTALLRTVPRRGYLMQATVMVEEAPPPSALTLLPPRVEDRPSIAVLPFRKGHADPQDAYFADGIVEGIVHVLSGLERILVISRGSALAVAERTVDPREAGAQLGVRYVLYGGVQRAGNRLRITTELSESETGGVLRTDRYDGDVEDIFALQDRIAERVVAVLAPQLRSQELSRAVSRPLGSLTAYELVLRALNEIRGMNPASLARGRALLEQSIATAPEASLAYSYLGWWYSFRIAQGLSDDVAADSELADRAAADALARDRTDGFAIALRGVLLGYTRRDFESARSLLDQAVMVSPSCALAWSWRALLHCWLGEGPEAVRDAERGYGLAPLDPFTFLHEHILSQAHYTAGSFEEAVRWGRASIASHAGHAPGWRTLMAALVALGRRDEAAKMAARVLALDPDFSTDRLAERTPIQPPLRDRFIMHLREAGLPD